MAVTEPNPDFGKRSLFDWVLDFLRKEIGLSSLLLEAISESPRIIYTDAS